MRGAVRRPNRGLRLHGSGKAGCVQLGHGESVEAKQVEVWFDMLRHGGYGKMRFGGFRYG